jgi:cell division protein FtsI/penicillin-binding protein 2
VGGASAERGAAGGGKNIYLTLDLHLQQYIEGVLKGQRAAVVVVDPRDGGVLAMVSSPSYDPNPFVKGLAIRPTVRCSITRTAR